VGESLLNEFIDIQLVGGFTMNLLQKRKKVIILIFIVAILSIPTVSYTLETLDRIHHQLPNNVYVDNINIGGKTVVQAEDIIDQRINQIENKVIDITLNSKGHAQKYKFILEDMGYYSDKDKIKSDVFSILHNDLDLVEKLKMYNNIDKSGRVYRIPHNIDFNRFANELKKIDVSNLSKPVNAAYKYENGKVNIVGGSSGYELDLQGLHNKILEGIRENRYEFTVDLKEVKPQITIESLLNQGIKEKTSSFITKFSISNRPRTSNIRLAASIIDGTILAPGETFSFNKTVGQRTAKRGFYKAGVYINGKLDEDVGGGICQVSTTLYNAVLLSDLEVIERSNHSLTVPYVPLSRDAAVSWGTKDFKFRNNTENYIYIHAQSTGNVISFELFGTKNHNRRVELISTVLNHIEPPLEYIEDESLELGKETVLDKGHDGYRSKLSRRVYEYGKLIDEQVLSYDRYLASPKVIKKGIKLVENTEV
jgi:vancomycin resistance protein YoaR